MTVGVIALACAITVTVVGSMIGEPDAVAASRTPTYVTHPPKPKMATTCGQTPPTPSFTGGSEPTSVPIVPPPTKVHGKIQPSQGSCPTKATVRSNVGVSGGDYLYVCFSQQDLTGLIWIYLGYGFGSAANWIVNLASAGGGVALGAVAAADVFVLLLAIGAVFCIWAVSAINRGGGGVLDFDWDGFFDGASYVGNCSSF